ncbi:MAG: hypothetical protein P4M07_24770 [Xanthobacteraceae bacterium]|nr:hypothetical protein [Xanthobacteraceae bacterium]
MNTARIVVLAIAVAAGGLAIRPLSGLQPEPLAEAAAARIAAADAPATQIDIQISQPGTAGDRARPDVVGSGASSQTTVQG